MKCMMCGNEVSSDNKYCPECGDINRSYIEPPVVRTESMSPNDPQYNPFSSNNYYGSSNVSSEPKSSAALVCGIVGIFVFGIILGIVGLVLAAKPNCSHPTASKVLGIINIIGGILWMFVYFG